MAFYRFYPSSDTTIYSESPLANTGLDEILELASYRDVSNTGQLSRILLKYDIQEINSIIQSYAPSTPVSASLNLTLADAYDLPLNFNIEVFPLSQSWDMGRGKYADVPLDITGASWKNRLANRSGSWNVTASVPDVTSSFYNMEQGGGSWYYQVSGSDIICSSSFSPRSNLDTDIDITKIVNLHLSGSIPNNGIIVKLQESVEEETTSDTRLRYFSIDTNTIYPPFVEIRWNDFVYATGSLNVLTSSISDIKITNNKGTYMGEEKIKFRLFCRPKYPTRTFTTSSIYTINHALPTSTYWALKDEHSKDVIVNFNSFNKVSCDSKGPYFTMYMNTLQPERYYRLLIKTELDGSEVIVDSKDNIFKVLRNV